MHSLSVGYYYYQKADNLISNQETEIKIRFYLPILEWQNFVKG